MAWKKIATKTPGVRYRLHPTRRHGINFDKYFFIRYRVDGRLKEEGLGWASEGWTEKKAAAELAKLKENITTSIGPRTLAEKRSIEQEERRKREHEEQHKAQQTAQESLLVINNVFSSYCEANAHKKSLKDEANYFKNWISPYIGAKKLGEVVLLDLERIRRKMTTEGNAPRSIQYIKSIVRQLYHFASAHKLYSGDPPTANFLKTMKNDNRRQRYLSLAEGEALLDQVRKYSEKTYQISLLSLHTAMRFGEIANLLWQHVSPDNREILVIDPKNGETRAVYMTGRVLEMFSGMAKGRPDELVFPSSGGGKRPRISKVFFKAIDDLGLNQGITDRRMQVVFHSLRHSCASILVNSGVEIPIIAKILGHKTLSMTMRYSHVNDRSVRNAMSVLDGQQTEDKIIPTSVRSIRTA